MRTSDEDIAWIIDTSVEDANDLVQKARRLLEGPNIDKRLEFLNTSYRRLRPSFNVNNIFNSKPTEEVLSNEPVKEMNRKRKNKPLYLWLIGSAMLVLLLTVSVFRSEAYQRSSAEKFIEDKKLSFQSELEKRFDMIGLAESDDRKVAFTYGNGNQVRNELFGSDIEWEFNMLIRKLESQVEGEGKINKKEASHRYDEIIHEMRLPSEMLEQLRSNPIKNREESIEFLNEFYIKNQFLENYYTGIIFGEHAEFFWESEVNAEGIVDIDEFLKRKSEYPDELRKALDGMETQFFSLTAIKDYAPISIAYNNPEVRETLQQNLHVDIDAYLFLIMDGLNVIFIGTDSERLETLIELDRHFPKTRESDPSSC